MFFIASASKDRIFCLACSSFLLSISVDSNEKKFDRDEFNYSQFLLKGSKIVDRATTFDLKVPAGGQVFLGVK